MFEWLVFSFICFYFSSLYTHSELNWSAEYWKHMEITCITSYACTTKPTTPRLNREKSARIIFIGLTVSSTMHVWITVLIFKQFHPDPASLSKTGKEKWRGRLSLHLSHFTNYYCLQGNLNHNYRFFFHPTNILSDNHYYYPNYW